MLSNTKSLTTKSNDLDDIVLELYQASCIYIQNRIVGKAELDRFIKTSSSVRDILLNGLSNNPTLSAFDATNKALIRNKNQLLGEQHFRSIVDRWFGVDIQKYDDYAFDIAFEILQKIKIRFIDGYVG
jgi:hypothetical protein